MKLSDTSQDLTEAAIEAEDQEGTGVTEAIEVTEVKEAEEAITIRVTTKTNL